MPEKKSILIDGNKDRILFWFEDQKNQNEIKLIDFNKLISTILFKGNFNTKDSRVIDFLERIKKSLMDYLPIKFANFIVNFEENAIFSIYKKVPLIYVNNEEFEWNNDFEKLYNEILKDLIKDGYYVEFLPNIILYFSDIAGILKLYIKKSYFMNDKGEENGK
ncbi:MSC_0623 family F1-like ATPase-associated protein [Mycoplasma sp. 2575]